MGREDTYLQSQRKPAESLRTAANWRANGLPFFLPARSNKTVSTPTQLTSLALAIGILHFVISVLELQTALLNHRLYFVYLTLLSRSVYTLLDFTGQLIFVNCF